MQKRWKWRLQPALGVRSTQMLVEIYNKYSYNPNFVLAIQILFEPNDYPRIDKVFAPTIFFE